MKVDSIALDEVKECAKEAVQQEAISIFSEHPIPSGVLLRDVAGEDVYITGTGQVLGAVHSEDECEGGPCLIHSPSNHSMRESRTHWRPDRRIMERLCPHGVGHPDPDDKAVREGDSVHGCDGCCVTVAPRSVRTARCASGVGEGWYPIVEAVEVLLDGAAPGWISGQVKEKFGGLRFYVDAPDEVFTDGVAARKWPVDAIQAITIAAESASYKTCELCGRPGKLRRKQVNDVSVWWMTRCDGCWSKEDA